MTHQKAHLCFFLMWSGWKVPQDTGSLSMQVCSWTSHPTFKLSFFLLHISAKSQTTQCFGNSDTLREFIYRKYIFKKTWLGDSNLPKSILCQNKQKMDTKHRFILTSLAHLQTKILHVEDHLVSCLSKLSVCQQSVTLKINLTSLKILFFAISRFTVNSFQVFSLAYLQVAVFCLTGEHTENGTTLLLESCSEKNIQGHVKL